MNQFYAAEPLGGSNWSAVLRWHNGTRAVGSDAVCTRRSRKGIAGRRRTVQNPLRQYVLVLVLVTRRARLVWFPNRLRLC